MKSEHDLVIKLPDNRVLKATVECDWSYERNPGDKELNHYGGEDDGYYLEDWSLLGECEVDGVSYPQCPPDLYDEIEREVGRLSPED